MVTPRETRFARIALRKHALSREQLAECLEYQDQKRELGSKMPLWDCAVLRNMLDQNVAEKLVQVAGDLNVDSLEDFTVVAKLGQGGMGSVYLGTGPDGRRVAIKVLAEHLAKERSFLTRFFREAEASCKLRHRNIVRGIKVGESDGHYFFAMEYVDGTSVESMLEKSGPLPAEKATDIILQAGEGLAYAHERGFIHRDIKPANIMVTRDGVAKLADLGLARQVDVEQTALTRTGTTLGTPVYMAPEQAMDAKRADARSDIYALGATWYHMLAGRPPFEGETTIELIQQHMKEPLRPLESIVGSAPRAVSLTIDRMMAKDPDQRIQTAREVCEAIREKCLGPRDVTAELGVKRKKRPESLWDVKIAVGGQIEKRRFSLPELRKLIRKHQVTRETMVKRGGTRDSYQPAHAFRELQREFPGNYAVSARAGMKTQASSKRSEMHELMTHFEEKRAAYRRRKKLRKLVPALLKVAGVLVAGGAIFLYRSQIWSLVQGLLERSPEGS